MQIDLRDRSILIAALCVVGAVLPVTLGIMWSGRGPTDFNYFWNAGHAVMVGARPRADFVYPPHSLFLFLPFALVPPLLGWLLFNVLGLALFYFAARPCLPQGFPSAFALATPAVLFCVLFGQTGLFFGALWLWAFQGRWQAAALLTFKPHLSVLSALSLTRRTMPLAFALALAVIAISAIILPDWWRAFLPHLLHHSGEIGSQGKWQAVGVGPAMSYGFAGWALFAGTALYLVSKRVDAFTAATAALLVSPYAFHYDMPAASLGFAVALFREKRPAVVLVLAMALMVPVFVRFGAWIAPPLLLLALWCQITEETE